MVQTVQRSKIVLIFLFTLFLIQLAQADTISINSGGGTRIAVGSDAYTTGFFFGDGSAVSEEESDDDDDGGGGGGGGTTTPLNIGVSPSELNVNIAVNTEVERTIVVTNLGTGPVTIGVSQQNLSGHIAFTNASLRIQPGQSADLGVTFIALNKTGIYTGKIFVGGKTVLVSLNVKTQLLNLDSRLSVLNSDLKVAKGQNLIAKITLTPLGEPEELDVNFNFTIKDYENKLYFTKTEFFTFNSQIELTREFDIEALSPGDYVLGLELTYLDGNSTSSARFSVVENLPTPFSGRVTVLIIMLLLIAGILITSYTIWRKERQKRILESRVV